MGLLEKWILRVSVSDLIRKVQRTPLANQAELLKSCKATRGNSSESSICLLGVQ